MDRPLSLHFKARKTGTMFLGRPYQIKKDKMSWPFSKHGRDEKYITIT